MTKSKAADGAGSIGTLNYAIFDHVTGQLIFSDRKALTIDDIEISLLKTSFKKTIELGNHFSFSFADSATRSGPKCFGLSSRRDDVRSFAWVWFEEDYPGHAKHRDLSELHFDTKNTPNGNEIHCMEFLTDVSIEVSRLNETPHTPEWRVEIYKGSMMVWPVLVDGEVQSL